MSTLKLDTLSNKAGTASVPSDTIVSGTAKAWVNFNGTGTVAIRRAFNVSSITDNSTGDYTLNFTTAFPDTNYCPTQMSLSHDTGGTQANTVIRGQSSSGATTMTTTALRINTGVTSSNVFVDRAIITVAIFS